ncbi:hypothetical protein [Amycolatopsis sp. NPDC059021]
MHADVDADAAAWWLLSLLAAQRFRLATAVGCGGRFEARLAASTLAFLTG